MNKYVKYLRVSTKRQGQTGLGLDAQSEIIDYFTRDGIVVGEYREVYTGTNLRGCVELQKAIDFAIKNDAKLIIYKSDRFRNLSEALDVMARLGEGNLICCDIPNADRFTFILFFAIAEREALLTSIRTKQALHQKKLRIERNGSDMSKTGNITTHLGRESGTKGVPMAETMRSVWDDRIGADNNRRRQYLTMLDLKSRGLSLREIADTMNGLNDYTASGGMWHAGTISRFIKKGERYFVK